MYSLYLVLMFGFSMMNYGVADVTTLDDEAVVIENNPNYYEYIGMLVDNTQVRMYGSEVYGSYDFVNGPEGTINIHSLLSYKEGNYYGAVHQYIGTYGDNRIVHNGFGKLIFYDKDKFE